MDRRGFLEALVASAAYMSVSPRGLAQILVDNSAPSTDFDAQIKETMSVLAGRPPKNADMSFFKTRIQSTIALQDTVRNMSTLKTTEEKRDAVHQFNGRYNSSYKDKDDETNPEIIQNVSAQLTPQGITKFVKAMQDVAPYISGTFEEASDLYGDISDILGYLPMPEKVNQFANAMDIASKVSTALAWAADEVPESDSLINEKNIGIMDAAVRAEFTLQLIELHEAETQQNPGQKRTLDHLLEDPDLRQNEHLKDTFDALQFSPEDLLANNLSDLPEDVRAVLAKAISDPSRKPTADVSDEYLTVLNKAVGELNENAGKRIALNKEIKGALEADKAAKIAKKADLKREIRNQDAAVYLGATLLGRTGNPEAAQAITVTFQAYKQLTFLSQQNVEQYGTAAMTAGYVGVALLIADNVFSSSQPSAEAQMMASIKHMFEALQKSIEDFREEVNDKLDGLTNGQSQILYAIEEAANEINANAAVNTTKIRNEMSKIKDLVKSNYELLHDQITKHFNKVIIDSVSTFQRSSNRTLNDLMLSDLEKAFEVLSETVDNPSYPGPHALAFRGDYVDKWNAAKINQALDTNKMMSPDFHIGVIPALVDGFRSGEGISVTRLPNPVEWSKAASVLLNAYYNFPKVGRDVETRQGAFLYNVSRIAGEINRATEVLMSDKTIQAALSRYRSLTEMFSGVMGDVYNEIVLNVVNKQQGKKPISSNEHLINELSAIGEDNLPQFYPSSLSWKQIDDLAKSDRKWADGRLDITRRDLRSFSVSGIIYGDLQRPDDRTYINDATLQTARKGLFKKPVVPGTMFINKEYGRYKIKGKHHKGLHSITRPDGSGLVINFRDRNIQINERFEINYDVLGLSQKYGLLSMATGKWAAKPLYADDVYGGKVLFYGEVHRNRSFSIVHGPSMSFDLRQTFLAAPKNLTDPEIRKKNGRWANVILSNDKRIDFSSPSYRLEKAVHNFGTEKRHVKDSADVVKAVHRELYLHQNNVKVAVVTTIERLVSGVPHTKGKNGIGLETSRYNETLKVISNLIEEMQAVSASLRLMSGYGLMIKGVDVTLSKQAAQGVYTSKPKTDPEKYLPSDKNGIIGVIRSLSKPKQVPFGDKGEPLNLKEYITSRFNSEVLSRLQAYKEMQLDGLENVDTFPQAKSVSNAVRGIRYIK